MGGMVPGQPNYFATIMAAYLDGVEKRRAREMAEEKLALEGEDRAFRREQLKLQQQQLKIEEMNSKRLLSGQQFEAIQGTPARHASLPGTEAAPGGISVGPDGSLITQPSIPQVNPREITLPHQQIDFGGGQVASPMTLEQQLFAGREKEIAKNAVPTGGYGSRYRGPYIDNRLLSALPPQVEAVTAQPGVVPGQVLDAQALTASSGVMNEAGQDRRFNLNEQGEASRAAATNAIAAGRLGLDRERLNLDRETAATGGAAQVKNDIKVVAELPEKVKRAETLVQTLQAAKDAHAQLRMAGPVAGRWSPDTSAAAQKLRQARAIILTRSNPLKGQGQVSNFERQLAEGTVPDSSVDTAVAGPIFDRLIEEAQMALQADQEVLAEAQARRTRVGVNPQRGPAPALGGGGPVRVNSPAEAARLPKGTQFIDPNGVLRTVP